MNKGKLGLVVLSLVAISAPLVLAQTLPPADVPAPVAITSVAGLIDVIRRVIGWLYNVFFAAAAFFFLWAAFDYLRAGGESALLESAKSKLLYGVIAVVVAVIAFSIPNFVATFLKP